MVNSSSLAMVESIPESVWVVMLAALLLAVVSLYAWWAWELRRVITAGPSANKGINKKLVEALPKFAYNSANQYFNGGDCAICLEEYADGHEIRVLPQCGHGFHVECIDKWLGSHSSCPSCRRILVISRCKKCDEFPASSAGKVSMVAEHDDSSSV